MKFCSFKAREGWRGTNTYGRDLQSLMTEKKRDIIVDYLPNE